MAIPPNGHGPPAPGTMSRTNSFAPITPIVKERVGDVANRLFEVEKIIDDLNLQSTTSTTRSPSMGDLQQEIDLLRKDIESTKAVQKKQIDELRNGVKNDVKEQITKSTKVHIEKKITESIEAQVKVEVAEWGQSAATKKLVDGLKKMIQDNSFLHNEARVKLYNSRARHDNSTLDEHADFEAELAGIKLLDGGVSKAFPRTLKDLFSCDEQKLLQLLEDYDLRKLDNHVENLNRFLAFIGLRCSIPEQTLDDFLDEPPAYPSPDILEPSKEEESHKVSPVSPPNQGENKIEVIPGANQESKNPPQQPAVVNTNPVQVQEKPIDENQVKDKHELKKDNSGQNPVGIELSTFSRRSSAAAMSQRPQAWPPQTSPTFPARAINRHPPPTTSLPSPNPQGTEGVTGWFKSLTSGL